MKKLFRFWFFLMLIFFSVHRNALASLAPLKTADDGVEPLQDPGMMIDCAVTDVSCDSDMFLFRCEYALKGLRDGGSLLVGVPGDLGYSMEAGHIENINVSVDKSPVECKVMNTTRNLSSKWKSYGSPLNFKWYTFKVPMQKGRRVDVSILYEISWKALEDYSYYPYKIVPFLLSTDRLFGDSVGSYRINYYSDEYISPPDVKVLTNSMLEHDIISEAILSPTLTGAQISWNFSRARDFQDFKLVVLSFQKLSLDFISKNDNDHNMVWAVLNNDYAKLSSGFEDIAKGISVKGLSEEDAGTAAYLSAEYYSRLKKFEKASEILSSYSKTSVWFVPVKAEYIYAMQLKASGQNELLLDEYRKLSQYKDYVLVSSYASAEIPSLAKIVGSVESRDKEEKAKVSEQMDRMLKYFQAATIVLLILILIILERAHRAKKNRG